MSATTSRTLVLVAGGLMFAAIGLRRDRIADPFKFAWAAGVVTLFLSVLADVAPEIAGPFALLVLMAVYWRNRGLIGASTPLGSASRSSSRSSLSGVTSVQPRPSTAGGPQ